MVVGGGQSALESAALLTEAGAQVEVIARSRNIHWLRGTWLRQYLGPLRPLVYPSTDVGPPGLNWIVARPYVFRQLPPRLRERVARRSIRPAGAPWLQPRLRMVPLTTGRAVTSVVPSGARIQLGLNDGTERRVDHVLLATGYSVDATKYPFLAACIMQSLSRSQGYPVLTTRFESSVPGVFFLGASAAHSFGPLLRFVSGTGYAARTLTRYVTGHTSVPAAVPPPLARTSTSSHGSPA